MKKSKKFIILVLLISIMVQGLMGNITYSQNNSKDHTEKLFSDITNHWAKESINFLAEKDYVSGYVTDEGYVIKPDSKITRAEYLAVLLKTKKLEVIKEKTKEFTDVKDNNWFKEMVDIASSNGIPEGYPDGSFKPNNPITRAEIAALLVKLNNWTLDELNLTIDNFIDVEKNSWFYSPVMICKERGIINGYSDKSFKPHNYASRGEAFTLIANYVKSLNSTELDREEIPAAPESTPENEPENTHQTVPTPTSTPTPRSNKSSGISPKENETSNLEIYVYNNNQEPLKKVEIIAIPKDKNLKGISAKSDQNGYVKINILSKKEYKIIVKEEGYKSIVKENILLDVDEVKEEKIILHELINEIYVEHSAIIANQDITNRIYARILVDNDEFIEESESTLSPVELLVLNRDGNWDSKGFLFDNGNLTQNGDEIKGDQIYTNTFKFNESESRTLNLKIVVSMKNGEKLSKEFSIDVLKPLPDEIFENVLNINKYITKYASEYFSNNENANIEELVEELQSILTQDERIKEVNNLNGTIEIVLSSGLRTFIQVVNYEDMETMPRGSSNSLQKINNFQEISEEEYQITDYDFLMSKDILIWSPFDTKWGEAAETIYIEDIVKESVYKYNLDILRDEYANIESLKEICEYGIIVFSTHGINGDWIVTGEKVEDTQKYRTEQQRGEVSIYNIIDKKEGNIESYYMVNSKWFERNIQRTFPKSIIINNSCESAKTELLWDVFKKKGASTYYGYTDKITNEYVVIQSIELLSEIILGGKSTLEAYNPSLDRYYNDGGMLIIKGQANLKLPTGLINGGFENGLAGWQKDGDGRSITQLGSIRPTEGNRMGIISTGLGYTLVQGILNQSIYIPETANTISFDWNFLSEEFLEFIGSKFDDPFVVSITLETQNNEEIKVLDINVNKIAEMFNATQYDAGNLISVSPDIVFDKGDVWMTGWQTTEIDIKDYRNQNVILKFSVEDAVDTIYTTAVLIDNVKFDVEDLYNGQRIEVDSSVFNEDYIRGIWFNDTKGSSYVLYCPDDFSSQAEFVRKQTKFFNGYKNIEQVKFHAIKTTKEFEGVWSNMEGHPNTGVIDDVILLFHSDYHAIFIDSSNRQYLTVCPDGFAGRGKTIYEAYHIRDLQKKKIKRIELLTCNNGLIDAVDTQHLLTDGVSKTKGNIAQAFLESQDVEIIFAFDGSLAYIPKTGLKRLAINQSAFYNYLEYLENIRKIKPSRTYGYIFEPRGWLPKPEPFGSITYYKDKKGNMSVMYGNIITWRKIGNYDE